jgi:hypothetical protein
VINDLDMGEAFTFEERLQSLCGPWAACLASGSIILRHLSVEVVLQVAEERSPLGRSAFQRRTRRRTLARTVRRATEARAGPRWSKR